MSIGTGHGWELAPDNAIAIEGSQRKVMKENSRSGTNLENQVCHARISQVVSID